MADRKGTNQLVNNITSGKQKNRTTFNAMTSAHFYSKNSKISSNCSSTSSNHLGHRSRTGSNSYASSYSISVSSSSPQKKRINLSNKFSTGGSIMPGNNSLDATKSQIKYLKP